MKFYLLLQSRDGCLLLLAMAGGAYRAHADAVIQPAAKPTPRPTRSWAALFRRRTLHARRSGRELLGGRPAVVASVVHLTIILTLDCLVIVLLGSDQAERNVKLCLVGLMNCIA